MTDRARENRRLAWLIVGTSATVTLVLAGVLAVWGFGQAKRWMAEQRNQRDPFALGERPVPPTVPPFDLENPDELRKSPGDDSDGNEAPLALPPGAPLSVPPGSARPLGDVARWVTSGDYPPAALRAGAEGRIRVTLTVNGVGRPVACRVAVSSGHGALDTATCDAMMLRGRFNPPGGTRRWTSPYIRWQIPRD